MLSVFISRFIFCQNVCHHLWKFLIYDDGASKPSMVQSHPDTWLRCIILDPRNSERWAEKNIPTINHHHLPCSTPTIIKFHLSSDRVWCWCGSWDITSCMVLWVPAAGTDLCLVVIRCMQQHLIANQKVLQEPTLLQELVKLVLSSWQCSLVEQVNTISSELETAVLVWLPLKQAELPTS